MESVMSTSRIISVLCSVVLFTIAMLPFQAQARPSDPFWHPATVVQASNEKACSEVIKTGSFGPRNTPNLQFIDHGCPKLAQAQQFFGPRNTIPKFAVPGDTTSSLLTSR